MHSVDTMAEARALLVRADQAGLTFIEHGARFATKLVEEQTLENLYAFGDALAELEQGEKR